MFESFFGDVRDSDYRFTVYRGGDPTAIEEWLTDHGVTVDHRPLPAGGPDPFVVLERDGEFAGSLGTAALEALLEPPVVEPGERDEAAGGLGVVFELIDDTVITGIDRRALLAVSREIEDRAYRVGTGTLRVGFQTLSTFESQVGVYRRLAAETDLDIHVYGRADWTPPEIPGVTYHEPDAEGIDRYWAIAFDGGADESQASGLLARKRDDGYDGFWTNDAGRVREISSVLAEL